MKRYIYYLITHLFKFIVFKVFNKNKYIKARLNFDLII